MAADLLNDRVIPFFDEHGIPLNRVLTDRGTEYCGAPERHEYELYLAVENIDHTRTTNGHAVSLFFELWAWPLFESDARIKSGGCEIFGV